MQIGCILGVSFNCTLGAKVTKSGKWLQIVIITELFQIISTINILKTEDINYLETMRESMFKENK